LTADVQQSYHLAMTLLISPIVSPKTVKPPLLSDPLQLVMMYLANSGDLQPNSFEQMMLESGLCISAATAALFHKIPGRI